MQKEYTPPVKLFSEQLQVRLFPDNADLSTLLKIEIMARDGKANYPNDLRLEVTNLFWPTIRDILLRESTESKEGSLINSVANNLKRNYTEHWIQRYHHPLTRWKIDKHFSVISTFWYTFWKKRIVKRYFATIISAIWRGYLKTRLKILLRFYIWKLSSRIFMIFLWREFIHIESLWKWNSREYFFTRKEKNKENETLENFLSFLVKNHRKE